MRPVEQLWDEFNNFHQHEVRIYIRLCWQGCCLSECSLMLIMKKTLEVRLMTIKLMARNLPKKNAGCY